MVGLVLEGGTFRPIYSAGIMDALLDRGILLPYCVGVSAGISNGVSYISGQSGRNLEILLRYRRDRRYVGLRNFIGSRSLFGLDFIYDRIPNGLVPLDRETLSRYPGQLKVGVTNALTGRAAFLDGCQMDRACTVLRATCAIPLLFPPILINGTPYYDGGICNPIPYEKALAGGCDKLIVILTRPSGYIKSLSQSTKMAARHMRKRFPALEPVLLSRHEAYNAAVAKCRQLERSGKALVFRPEYPLNSMEKNTEQIKANYKMGYELAVRRMEEIRAFIGEPYAAEK